MTDLPLTASPRARKPEAEQLLKQRAHRKTHGVHYTPAELAGFVARRALAAQKRKRSLVVLDPACGDGELLAAIAQEAERAQRQPPHLVGVDRDQEAVLIATERLKKVRAASVRVQARDFLAASTAGDAASPEASLTANTSSIRNQTETYDLIISNPPYVRTQELGSVRAQELGRQFGLTGRVDLYHAFVAAMTMKLGDGGVLGLLCSNRFLSTKGGQSMRSLLLQHYELVELWDLGDTRMFGAAILPAVVISRRVPQPAVSHAPASVTPFVRVYEREDTASAAEDAVDGKPGCASTADSTESEADAEEESDVATSTATMEDPARDIPEDAALLSVLESEVEGEVLVGARRFIVERGQLTESSGVRPWRLSSRTSSRWLGKVASRSSGTLGDLGPIRVGIKTTADSVFIRRTWNDLPVEQRPESELLHPLLTHHVAARWQAEDAGGTRSVLYPHEMREGRRCVIDLTLFPRALAYLEQYRPRLEGRDYVRKAGRAWYEIWVPQQPSAWAAPKLVWPDISSGPKFYLDESGAIVNGDCYWLTCGENPEEEVALALAVANSTFALQHYDLCCGNRLYAGRRRFITQYLEGLPLPRASATELREVASAVARLRANEFESAEARTEAEASLDGIVFELFGLTGSAR